MAHVSSVSVSFPVETEVPRPLREYQQYAKRQNSNSVVDFMIKSIIKRFWIVVDHNGMEVEEEEDEN